MEAARFASTSTATTPVVTAADMLVPLRRKYVPLFPAAGTVSPRLSVSSVLCEARTATSR